MKIQVNFYRENTDENIKTFYDLTTNPFKVGQRLNLRLEDFYPVETKRMQDNGWHEKLLISYLENYEDLRKNYHSKQIELISEYVQLDLKDGNEKIIFDYYFKIVPSENYK